MLKDIDYDDNGSTIKEEAGSPATATREYIYDAQDRMVEVRDNATTIAKYAYEPMGRRAWRQTFGANASITWFLFSDEGLMGEYSAANVAIREYGWQASSMWGTDPVWQKDAIGLHLMQNDHLFTSEVLTAASDGTQEWGALRESLGATSVRAGSETEHLLRFPGQWEDAAIDLVQNHYRDYEPEVGRYVESDPIGLDGGVNYFLYANGNPGYFIDQTGENPVAGALVVILVAFRAAILRCMGNRFCRCNEVHVAYKAFEQIPCNSDIRVIAQSELLAAHSHVSLRTLSIRMKCPSKADAQAGLNGAIAKANGKCLRNVQEACKDGSCDW